MKKLLLFLILFASFSISYSQSIDELQRAIKKAEEEIKKGNALLQINKNQQSSNMERITITRNNIRNREKIIYNLTKQTEIIIKEIETSNNNIKNLSKELDSEKRQYAKIMVSGYKKYISNRNLMFLFSATSFYDLQLRIYYLKKYGQKKIDLARDIERKSVDINHQLEIQFEKKASLEKTTGTLKTEINNLERERKGYSQLAEQLKKEDKKLNKKIEDGIKAKKSLEKKIADIIAEESRKRAAAKFSEADKAKNIALNDDFSKNRGILPSPVDGGTIIESFGTHKHPLYPSLTVNNNGIDISVKDGSSVKAVFKGVITRIFVLQGLNTSVMIRHGDYITVYSGLDVVSVKTGDTINTGGVIGKVNANGQSSNAVLHFELWKSASPQNPDIWLR